MQDATKLPGYRWFGFLQYVPVRIGVYTGACLSLGFALWVVAANRVPFLEPVAHVRNLVAIILLLAIAAIPVARFYRNPAELLCAAIVGWSLLSVTFYLLALIFTLLDESYSAFHIFMMGAVVYLLVATVAWIGTIIRRARASHISHLNHHH
jgi:hypothetical protein